MFIVNIKKQRPMRGEMAIYKDEESINGLRFYADKRGKKYHSATTLGRSHDPGR
jgi:hypothetical protein